MVAAVACDGESLNSDWPSEMTPINAAPEASTAMARRASRWAREVGRFGRERSCVMGWCRIGRNAAWRNRILANAVLRRQTPHERVDHDNLGRVAAWRQCRRCESLTHERPS